MTKWKAQFFEVTLEDFPEEDRDYIDPDELDYEYSAVRESNKHGQRSWGWGGEDKIILFSSGIGGNTCESRMQARKIVIDFVKMLNDKGH